MRMTKTQSFRFVVSNNVHTYGKSFVISFPLLLNLRKQVSVNDEGRDMWKVYLNLKEFTEALANCRDPLQRDQVYLEQVRAYGFH